MGFPINFSRANAAKIILWEDPGISITILLLSYDSVFLLDQIPIIWMVYGYSNEFLLLWVNSANSTCHMVTTLNINTYTFLIIWVISLPSKLRSRYKKTKSSHLLQVMFLLPDLILTKWVSRHIVRVTSHGS